jgi:phage terminase large subunit-like protein
MSDLVVRPPSAPYIDAYKVAVKYATDVLTGQIVAGKLLKLCAKRFIQDLKFGSTRGITFDKEAAQHVVDFFGTLRHWKAEWGKGGGQPFILSPWQTFILANLFGFKRANGTRRFREAHIEVARKNGKTTFMAGIGLYMLVADDEPGAEVYCIATKKDQAREVFDCAVNMRAKSKLLSQRVSVSGGAKPNNLSVLSTQSKFELQASDYGSADGKNVHCLIADELHQHPTRLLYDAYYESTGARSQPLVIAITTAGYNTMGICFAQRKIAENILVGNVAAEAGDSVFAYIACLDEPDKDGKGGDDYKDEACWPKANPNLGVSVKLDNMREAAAKAASDPTALNSFLCKRLNVWTSQEIRWMPPEKWAACNAAGPLANPLTVRAAAYERLKGRIAIGGLDLSSKFDLSSFVLLFPPVKERIEKIAKPQTREEKWAFKPVEYEERVTQSGDPFWSVLAWFWVPKDNIPDRVKKDRVHYDVWERDGYLLTCPGTSIDHEFIYKYIINLRKDFNFTDIAFDSWNAQWISKKLEGEGFKPEAARPTYQNLSEPMKELMACVLKKSLEHFGDPILAWNAGNVAATTDAAGSIKPDKEKSKEKIDGVVALIMAMSRIVQDPTLAGGGSIYSERGIVFL